MAVRTPTASVGAAASARVTRRPGAGALAREDHHVLPRRLRHAGTAYVLLAVPLTAVLAGTGRGERSYVDGLAVVAAAYALPGLACGLAVQRRVAVERLVWRLWAAGFGVTLVTALLVQHAFLHPSPAVQRAVPVASAVAILLIAAGNTLVVRSRSGQRTVAVDAVETIMATLAAVVPVGLLVGDEVVASPDAWFVGTMAMIVVGGCHGLVLAATVAAWLPPGARATAARGMGLMVAIMADAGGAIVQGLDRFRYPTAPFAALHAACLGMVLVFFLWSDRRQSTGLDRLPPQAQVRRRSTVTVLVLATLPVIGVEAWLLRDDRWVAPVALAAAIGLLVLSSVRHLLSARETIRLYGAVERAADERGALLADVLGHVDADRHRVAAHLHRRAVALYTAMASFAAALDRADDPPAAVGVAAERMRADLARQVDELRQVAIAVEPLPRAGGAAHRLAALVRAYVGNLYGDAPAPRLTVDVDDGLVLDWATEAIVLRIVQEATHNAWRHARATRLRVAIGADAHRLRVEVADDGVGIGAAGPGRGIDSMRAVAGFIGGRLTIESPGGGGTSVVAVVDLAPPALSRRPHLRLVD